jgi:hypothetical protein
MKSSQSHRIGLEFCKKDLAQSAMGSNTYHILYNLYVVYTLNNIYYKYYKLSYPIMYTNIREEQGKMENAASWCLFLENSYFSP